MGNIAQDVTELVTFMSRSVVPILKALGLFEQAKTITEIKGVSYVLPNVCKTYLIQQV